MVAADRDFLRIPSFVTFVQVSRPGLYHGAMALYLLSAAADISAAMTHRALLGLLFVVFPVNLTVYAMNDLRDVDIDAKNSRKGGLHGAQATSAELRFCVIVGVLACLSLAPLLTQDLVWAMVWNFVSIGANYVYNFGPTLSRVPFLDMFPPLGYLLIIPFGSKVMDVPYLPEWVGWYMCALVFRTQLWFQRMDVEDDAAVGKRTTAVFVGRRGAAAGVLTIMAFETCLAQRGACSAALAWTAYSACVFAVELYRASKRTTLALMFVGGLLVFRPFTHCLSDEA